MELTLLYRERGVLEEWLARSRISRSFTAIRMILVAVLGLGAIAAITAVLVVSAGGRHAASALSRSSERVSAGDLRLRHLGGLNAADARLRRYGGINAGADLPGPPGVAAAYGYPPRCLSITISTVDPGFARADYNHANPCGQYDGYVTAIFHRLDGRWRPVLDALGYTCPVPSVPAGVQRQLAICPSPTRSPR